MKKIIYLVIFGIAFNACKQQDNNKIMDKNTFWKIIETAKNKSGTNMELRYNTWVSLLVKFESIKK